MPEAANSLPAITATGLTLAPLIDHTLLKADSRSEQISQLCREARHYHFAAVCILPLNLPLAVASLAGSAVKPITVISFPLGGASSAGKAAETAAAVRAGAQEVDMVMAVGALKEGAYAYVQEDIAGVVAAAQGCTVKVIIETALLSDPEKIAACQIAQAAGAHFVKTSSGTLSGATLADVRLLRQNLAQRMGVKASGGIRTSQQALAMIAAGATRLGTSAGVSMVTSL